MSLSLRIPSFKEVILATEEYSLARYSKRTTQPRRAVSDYRHQVSGSFNSPLGVLFNVPSRYYSLSVLGSI